MIGPSVVEQLYGSQQVTHSENPSGIITTFEDSKVESGNSLFRSFCSKCGSTLFVTSPKNPGAIIVPYGGLDDAPKEWKPTNEVWCRNKKEWIQESIHEQSF